MDKKFFFFGMIAVLGASLSFLGCESATNGTNGNPGAPGTIVLSGEVTAAGIQYAIDSVAPVVFAGVVQSDDGFISIPAGKGVTLVGGEAYSVKTGVDAQLVLDSNSISTASTGKIAKGDGTLLIVGPADVLDGNIASDVPPASKVALQSGTIDTSVSNIAVQGTTITISTVDTSATNIKSTELTAGKTLYVIGDLTVSAAITGAIDIFVVGNAKVETAAQTAVVDWQITGNLTATKTPTASGTISVKGTADFTEALSAKIIADGKATFTAAATFVLASSLNGGAEFKGNVTSSAGQTEVSSGAAEFTATGGNTLTGYLSADNVTITNKLAIESGSLATGAQITLTDPVSIVLGNGTNAGGGIEFTATGKLTSSKFELSGAGSLLNDTTQNGGTTVTFAAAGITRGGGSGTASIVFADQTHLIFKDDAEISGLDLKLTDGGSISIEGANKSLKLTGGGSITAANVQGTLGAGNLYIVTNTAGSLVAGTNIIDPATTGSLAAGSYGTFTAVNNFIHGGVPFVFSGTEAAFGTISSYSPAANSGVGAGSVVVFTLNTP